MGIFDGFIKYLTEDAKKDGFRLWVGKTGNSYIKKGGKGRGGTTISFSKKKK